MDPNAPDWIRRSMNKKRMFWNGTIFVIVIVAVFMGLVFIFGRAPDDFVPGTTVVIPRGTSTGAAAKILKSEHVIRSAGLFDLFVGVIRGGAPVIAGNFEFDHPVNVVGAVGRLTGGAFGAAQKRVTVPEGATVLNISQIMAADIPGWNAAQFVTLAKSSEGYLFPATYDVFKSVTPQEFLATMKTEYENRVAPLRPEIAASGHSERDIIIMASILQREAFNGNDAPVIAGILWKRLKNGQPLQVDAPFYYIDPTGKLTRSDLQTDGPYNTYLRTGLPAGPICNPGMTMILAALRPTSSPYNYYIHDKTGAVHYATTYAQHVANINKYLK